jgi:hypothetical protein
VSWDDYKIQDFRVALKKFYKDQISLDYDSLASIATEIITDDLVEDLKQFEFNDSILAAFANGLVIGLLVAETKYKPKDPLIKH